MYTLDYSTCLCIGTPSRMTVVLIQNRQQQKCVIHGNETLISRSRYQKQNQLSEPYSTRILLLYTSTVVCLDVVTPNPKA